MSVIAPEQECINNRNLSQIDDDIDYLDEVKDIEIVTLKQYLKDKAAEDVWNHINHIKNVDDLIEKLLITKYTSAKEFVNIEDDKITIGIDALRVNNKAIGYAFDMLSRINYQELKGLFEFGNVVKVYEGKF